MKIPNYLEKDFFKQMISEKASFLSKATLAVTVPTCLSKHNFDCCWNFGNKADDMQATLQEFPLTKSPLEWKLSDCVSHVKPLGVESFQDSSNPAAVFNEAVEIIPSSNPESEGYGSDVYTPMEHFGHIPLYSEDFCQQHELGLKPLEEPLHIPNGTEASTLMPSLDQLLSKFEVVAVQDPLKKEDGTLWAENDFFRLLYAQETDESYDLQWPSDPLDADEFHKVTYNALAEPFMLPVVAKYNPETFKTSMCEPEMDPHLIIATKDFEQVLAPVDEKQTLEFYVDNLNGIEQLCDTISDENDARLFFLSINQSDTPETDVIRNVERTPILELRDIDINDGGDYTIQQSITADAIDTLDLAQEKTVNSASAITFLRSKERKKVELKLWLTGKYNDDMQITEPNMSPLEMPSSTIKQATDLITLAADSVETEVPCILTELSSIDIPLLQIDQTEADIGTPVVKPLEEFHTSNAVQLEISNLKREDWECLPVYDGLSKETSTHEDKDEERQRRTDFQEFKEKDPLDSFLFLRHKMGLKELSKSETQSEQRGEQDGDNEKKSEQSLPQGFEIRIQPVPFRGLMENLLQCLVGCVAPYLEYMKRAQYISGEETLMSISIDSTRFLFKDMEKQVLDQKESDSEHLLNALCLHTLRAAADYLINGSVEACCAYLVSQKERYKEYFKDKLEEVIKTVYHMQGEVLKKNILHPKQEYLLLEISKICRQYSGNKILVVVPRGLPHLQQSIKTLLCSVPQLSVAVLPDFTSQPVENKHGNMVCITQYVESMPAACLSQFSKVIQYDEGLGHFFKTACKKQECSYIGLVTELLNVSSPKGMLEVENVSTPFTLICSDEISHNKQLLCMLEARYNIFVIERDFSKLRQKGFRHPSADITFSPTHCAVLLPLVEMDQQWNMEKEVKRYLALGLQYSFIFIIAHAIGLTTGYPIVKEVVANIHKLRASLSNLTRSSDYFDAQYKILIRMTEADVASSIRSLANMYINTQKDIDLKRSWLCADMTQQEEALLRLPCLNPFSAQMLLQKHRCKDVLGMSLEEISQAQPYVPESTLKCVKHMTSAWGQSVNNKPCSSQATVSTGKTIDTSFTSSGHSSASCTIIEEQNSPINKISRKNPLQIIKPLQTPGGLESSHIAVVDRRRQQPFGILQSQISEPSHSPKFQDPAILDKLHRTNETGSSNYATIHQHMSCQELAQSQSSYDPVQNSFKSTGKLYNTLEDTFETSNYTGGNMGLYVSREQLAQNASDESTSSGVKRSRYPYELNYDTSIDERRNHRGSHQDQQSDCSTHMVSYMPYNNVRDHSGNNSDEEICSHPSQFIHQGTDYLPEVSWSSRTCGENVHNARSLLPNVTLQADNLEPNEYCRYGSNVQDWVNYENMRSPIQKSQRQGSTFQYEERSGLSLLKEPEEKDNFFSSKAYGDRSAYPKSYHDEPACSFNTPYQGPMDATSHIKQETLTDEDPSYPETNFHGPTRCEVKEKPLSKSAFGRDFRNTYGIFSTTARRHDSIIFPPLQGEQSIQQTQMSSECPSHCRYNALESIDMFDLKNQPLPFSVSKALKRHISQVEEQNAFKAPRMFQVAQSGGAQRDNRITRRLNIDSMQIENSSRENALKRHFQPYHSTYKTNYEERGDANEIRKISASREEYPARMTHHQYAPPPTDFNVTPPSNNLQHHQTNQPWNVFNSRRNHSKKQIAKSLVNSHHEICSETSKPSQYNENIEISREATKLYDRYEQLAAPIHGNEEQHSLGIFSKVYEHKANVIKQVKTPDKHKSHGHTISPSTSSRTCADNKTPVNPLQRNQREDREEIVSEKHTEMQERQQPVCHVLYAQSGAKTLSSCNSKWKKYESNIDENLPLYTSPYRRDSSPPMDLPCSADISQPMRCNASSVQNIHDGDSKLKKWQLYLQQQTLRSQGEENFSS